MKWMTRERAKVDRIACPWLISRFIDPQPEFLYVPAEQVLAEATTQGAIPYDVPNVELGHKGPLCSFDALMHKYALQGTDPALDRLALIVRGADTADKDLTPASRGLDAIAGGFQQMRRGSLESGQFFRVRRGVEAERHCRQHVFQPLQMFPHDAVSKKTFARQHRSVVHID